MPGLLTTIGWIVVCIVVPVAWGITVNAVFDYFSSRRGTGRNAAPPEYYI